MKKDKILLCLLAFLLGFTVFCMIRRDGLIVGGEEKIDDNFFTDCYDYLQFWDQDTKDIAKGLCKPFICDKTSDKLIDSIKSGVCVGGDLSNVDLSNADLSHSNLEGADLTNASLSGADLTNASLSGADLTNVNASGAYLSGADLTNASLSGAHLEGAVISPANLSGADLTNAHLERAVLSAGLTDANLSGASCDSETKLPTVFNYTCKNGKITTYQ